MICTGSLRSPMRRACESADDLAQHRVERGVVGGDVVIDQHGQLRRRDPELIGGGGRDHGGELIAEPGSRPPRRPPRRWSTCRTRPGGATSRRLTSAEHRPPTIRNNNQASPRRTTCSLADRRTPATAMRRGPPPTVGPWSAPRSRRCCGVVSADVARGAGAAARSSVGGSPRTDRCHTCGISWQRGYEGFELGAMTISAIVCLGTLILTLVVAIVITWPDLPVVPLLAILGVGALALPVLMYPISYTSVAGDRSGDAPSGGGRRRCATARRTGAFVRATDQRDP